MSESGSRLYQSSLGRFFLHPEQRDKNPFHLGTAWGYLTAVLATLFLLLAGVP